MMPRVSVIVPGYNSSEHLRECMDSISGQTLKDIEIICIDDGSSDSTLDIFVDYSKVDQRVKVISQKNTGPGIARNNGYLEATGKYVYFFDSDDYLKDSCLERLYEAAERNASEVTICRSKEFNDTGMFNMEWSIKEVYSKGKEVTTPDELGEHLFQFAIGWAWDKLFLKEFLDNNDIKFAPARNSEDLMLAFPAILMANRISIVDEVLIYHRTGCSGSVSNTRKQWPYCFIDTTSMLRQYIEAHKKNNNILNSYYNWAVEYTLWNLDSLPYWSKIKVYHKLRKSGLKKMDLKSMKKTTIEDSYRYERIKLIEEESTLMYVVEMILESYVNNGLIGSIKKV